MIGKLLTRQAVLYPILMLFAMWTGYSLQLLGIIRNCWGAIIPLAPDGLKGIFFSPLLHGSLEHILSNSVPIAALMFLLFQFYQNVARQVFLIGWVASGLLVWLLPPIDIFTGDRVFSCIIGASGIVYVLAFFLFFCGLFRWNMKLLTISLLVALYYGSLVWGVFPEELFMQLPERSNISWQSHLSGAVLGIILAFMYRKNSEKKKKFIWQFPEYYSERDDKLWQEYRENHPEDFQELPHKKKESIWDYLDELRRQKH